MYEFFPVLIVMSDRVQSIITNLFYGSSSFGLESLQPELQGEIYKRLSCKDLIRMCSTERFACNNPQIVGEVIKNLKSKNGIFDIDILEGRPFFDEHHGPYVMFFTVERTQYVTLFDGLRPQMLNVKQAYPKYDASLNNRAFIMDFNGEPHVGSRIDLKPVPFDVLNYINQTIRHPDPTKELKFKTTWKSRPKELANPARIDDGWYHYKETVNLLCELQSELHNLLQIVGYAYGGTSLDITFEDANLREDWYNDDKQLAELHVVLRSSPKKSAHTDINMRSVDSMWDVFVNENGSHEVKKDIIRDFIKSLKVCTSFPPIIVKVLKSMIVTPNQGEHAQI